MGALAPISGINCYLREDLLLLWLPLLLFPALQLLPALLFLLPLLLLLPLLFLLPLLRCTELLLLVLAVNDLELLFLEAVVALTAVVFRPLAEALAYDLLEAVCA